VFGGSSENLIAEIPPRIRATSPLIAVTVVGGEKVGKEEQFP
jgi:hypothetical protein